MEKRNSVLSSPESSSPSPSSSPISSGKTRFRASSDRSFPSSDIQHSQEVLNGHFNARGYTGGESDQEGDEYDEGSEDASDSTDQWEREILARNGSNKYSRHFIVLIDALQRLEDKLVYANGNWEDCFPENSNTEKDWENIEFDSVDERECDRNGELWIPKIQYLSILLCIESLRAECGWCLNMSEWALRSSQSFLRILRSISPRIYLLCCAMQPMIAVTLEVFQKLNRVAELMEELSILDPLARIYPVIGTMQRHYLQWCQQQQQKELSQQRNPSIPTSGHLHELSHKTSAIMMYSPGDNSLQIFSTSLSLQFYVPD